MKSVKIPMRMCVGCGEMKQKSELIRVVKTPDGAVVLDKTGKQNGRGAYICKSAACFKKAQKARRFENAFKAPIPAELADVIEKELESEQ